MNVLAGMPIVLVLAAQDVAHGAVGGNGAFAVEALCIAHSPHQLTLIKPADPVACDGGVFSCRLSQ